MIKFLLIKKVRLSHIMFFFKQTTSRRLVDYYIAVRDFRAKTYYLNQRKKYLIGKGGLDVS